MKEPVSPWISGRVDADYQDILDWLSKLRTDVTHPTLASLGNSHSAGFKVAA